MKLPTIITPVQVLQRKAYHWMRYTGTYRRLLEQGDPERQVDIDVCVAEYTRITAELGGLADSGNQQAQKVLKYLPTDPVDLTGGRLL